MLEALRARYPQLAPQVLGPFLDLLISARAICNGDMDSFMILLSVALSMTEHPHFAELRREEIEDGAAVGLIGSGTNIRSIADSTGIPRESVRRKIEAQEGAGLVVRVENRIYCTAEVFRAFTPVREALLRIVVKNHRTLEGIRAEGA